MTDPETPDETPGVASPAEVAAVVAWLARVRASGVPIPAPDVVVTLTATEEEGRGGPP